MHNPNSIPGRSVMDKLKSVFYCPITGNQSLTKISKKAFDAACQKHQSTVGKMGVAQVKSCMECQGKNIPKNIEFIEIQGGVMAEVRKSGRCSICSKNKSVLERGGVVLCSMCENMRSAIRKTPEAVLAQLRELAPDVFKYLPKDEQGPVNQKQLDALQGEVSRLNEANDLLEDWKISHQRLVERLEESQQEVQGWVTKYAALGDDLRLAERNLDDTIKALDLERETTRQLASKVDSMIDAELYGRQSVALEGNTAPTVPAALFDLALDALGGNITGLDADRLRALRGVM